MSSSLTGGTLNQAVEVADGVLSGVVLAGGMGDGAAQTAVLQPLARECIDR